MIKLNLPLSEKEARSLKVGERVLISGYIYTSRDAGHKRMCETINAGEKLPFDINGATIYYVGPTPAKEGQIIGSAGPTTSGRVDAYTPTLISLGLRAMIGKGKRSGEVIDAMKKHGCVYFGAIGGAGALISKCIKSSEPIAYEDLGSEALLKLFVEDMPLTVVIDADGNDLYTLGREEYLKTVK